MYIYQTARQELERAIESHAHYITGKVLDVGTNKYQRYKHLFNCSEYITVDPEQGADVVGDARSLPFPDASFDSIVCTQVIGDIFEVEKVFSEFQRVLKPGGRLLLTECFFAPYSSKTPDFWRFTPQSLARLATEARLTVVTIEQLGGYHSLLARMRLQHLLHRLNTNNRWQMALYNRFSKLVSKRAWRLDRKYPDSSHANSYLLIARKY